MAPVDLFCFLLFSYSVLILSTGDGDENGHQHNYCSGPFNCGHLGTFDYPFNKAEQPNCGMLAIHDCDNPLSLNKTIQLKENGKSLVLLITGVAHEKNTISILDEDFNKRLQQNTCATLNNNYSLPSPSPLFSFHIKFNVTLFRCNQSLNITPPTHYFKHMCPDYDIYYDSLPTPNNSEEAHSLFSSCAVLQLSTRGNITDARDILSFVSAEMVVQVLLSKDCDGCYGYSRGQCRLHNNSEFSCISNSPSRSGGAYVMLILGLVTGLSIILSTILIVACLFRRNLSSNNQQTY